MRAELLNLAKAYLMGWKSVRDCAEWLSSVDWNDPNLDEQSQKAIGLLELLVTEVLEGRRSEADLRQEASTLVARETDSLYLPPIVRQEFIDAVSSITTGQSSGLIEFQVVEAAEPQPWSISPLPVSV
jgi:hypothetical protein